MLRLFLSHSWDHDHHRDGLHRLIGARWIQDVDWCDTSVPRDAPLHVRGGAELRRELRARIYQSDALVVFAGIYSSHSDWIGFEVTTAAAQYKPVIGVRPRQQQNISKVVEQDAWEIVGWNGDSVTGAVLRNIPAVKANALTAAIEERARLWRYLATVPVAPRPPLYPWHLLK